MKSGYFTTRDLSEWTTTNHINGWSSSQENDAVYMVRSKGNPQLWAPFWKPSYWFKQVLLSIRPIEGSNWLKASRMS